MKEQMLIGGTLFSIESEWPVRWRPEEEQFRWRGEAWRQKICVEIRKTDSLPERLTRELYCTEGLRIGLDAEGNEVREYTAAFMAGRPLYAQSVLKGDTVTVDFVNDQLLWNNPNIRIWNLVHMEHLLLRTDALVLHCSYLMYEGRAILFSAPSGTGKTTQAKLWEKLYPARIINGDKAIIQKRSGMWYACGYPFHGSADECENRDYQIAAVIVVRQSPQDWIEELRPIQKLQTVYSECTVNVWDTACVDRALSLVGDLVASTAVVRQYCTMQDQACRTLHGYFEEKMPWNCTI